MTDAAEDLTEKRERPFIEPGWYRDLSNDDYHGSFGFSSSQVKTLVEQTPAHLRQNMGASKEETDNMMLGTLVHTLVLEPDSFATEFVLAPEGINKRTKAGREEWQAFEEAAQKGGLHVITKSMLLKAQVMGANVLNHPIAGALLADVIPESSVYWWYNSMDPDDSEDYRMMLKVRPDAISKAHPVVIDLKTTTDGSISGFQRSIARFHYDLSAAMYLEGVNQCKSLLKDIGYLAYTKFVFICVENFEPFLVSVYELDAEYMEIGKLKYRRALRVLQHGMQNDWPGYPAEVRLIQPPNYAKYAFIV